MRKRIMSGMVVVGLALSTIATVPSAAASHAAANDIPTQIGEVPALPEADPTAIPTAEPDSGELPPDSPEGGSTGVGEGVADTTTSVSAENIPTPAFRPGSEQAQEEAGLLAAPWGVRRYYWSQYQGSPTVMMPVHEGICILQGVTGNFRGGGEQVWIRNNGYAWELNGTSYQQDVAARALCVPFYTINGAYQGLRYTSGPAWVWFQDGGCPPWPWACGPGGGHSIEMGGLERFCYLTGMGGRFDGSTEYVRMEFYTTWRLGVQTYVDGGYVRAEGGCIEVIGKYPQTTNIFYRYRWDQGQPPVQLPNADQAFCVLNRVQGEFAGWGESVDISYGYNNTQWLYGSSYQEGVAAEASCFYYNQY